MTAHLMERYMCFTFIHTPHCPSPQQVLTGGWFLPNPSPRHTLGTRNTQPVPVAMKAVKGYRQEAWTSRNTTPHCHYQFWERRKQFFFSVKSLLSLLNFVWLVFFFLCFPSCPGERGKEVSEVFPLKHPTSTFLFSVFFSYPSPFIIKEYT